MHIAFSTSGAFDTNAALKRATGLADPLVNQGHRVSILIQTCEVNREKLNHESKNAMACWFPCHASVTAERRLKNAILEDLQPDMVWLCGAGSRNWLRKPSNAPIIIADHSELYSRVGSSLLRRASHSLNEWLHCLAFDAHICASQFLTDFYRDRLRLLGKPTEKVLYLPYAYPATLRAEARGNPSSIRSRFPGKKIGLYIGGLWENYGVWELLHAAKLLAKTRDDFILLLCGRGPEELRARNWIKENDLEDLIVLDGYVPENVVNDYLGAATFFLSPLQETDQDRARCPSKLFMYLPFHRPIVTCAVGEAYHLLGDNKFYYSPGNAQSLAHAMERALDFEYGPDTALLNIDGHSFEERVKVFLQWHEKVFSGA